MLKFILVFERGVKFFSTPEQTSQPGGEAIFHPKQNSRPGKTHDRGGQFSIRTKHTTGGAQFSIQTKTLGGCPWKIYGGCPTFVEGVFNPPGGCRYIPGNESITNKKVISFVSRYI